MAPENEEETVELIKKVDDYILYNAGRNWQDPDSNASAYLIEDLGEELSAFVAEEDVYEIYRISSQNS